MLQRFASALFGGDAEEVIGSRAEEEEQEEDWILVDCLGESQSLINNKSQYMQWTSAREGVQVSDPSQHTHCTLS